MHLTIPSRPRRVLLGALIALALALPTAAQAADYQPNGRPSETVARHSWGQSQAPRYHLPSWRIKPTRQVVRVIDGDTIDVATRPGATARVRLLGIDAPERGQRYARQSTVTLTGLTLHKQVRLEADPSQANKDRFGRLLRYVRMTPHGTNVNQRMVLWGAAREYTYDRPYRYQRVFKASERIARAAHRGLWGASPTRPTRPTPTQPIDKDCRDFDTQREAQAYFVRFGGSRANNVDGLDADRDGLACESLPR